MNMPIRLMLSAAVLLQAGAGWAADTPASAADGVMVGPNGMTLYTFDKDPAGGAKSMCVAQCAANWPPLTAPADAASMGDYSVVTRDDGSHQWAYKGKPLYYWTHDTKKGDRTGDGVNKVWHAAKP